MTPIPRALVASTLLAVLLAVNPGRGLRYLQNRYWTPNPTFVVRPYLQLGDRPATQRGELELRWETTPETARRAGFDLEVRAADGAWAPVLPRPQGRSQTLPGCHPVVTWSAWLPALAGQEAVAYRVRHGASEVFAATARPRRAAGQDAHFVVVGDCGTCSAEQGRVAQQIAADPPDLVCIPGDIVYPRGRIRDYRNAMDPFYNEEPGSRRGAPLARSVPFVAAPGNHDLGYAHRSWADLDVTPDALYYFLYWSQPLNGPMPAPVAAAARARDATGGSSQLRLPFPLLLGSAERQSAWRAAAGERFPRMTCFSFDYGRTHWTVLDSNERVDWKDPELVQWLERDLASAREATWRFVMYHHPPYHSSTAHAECRQMRAVAPLLERGGVDVVWSGHVHTYERARPLSVLGDGRDADHPHCDLAFDGRAVTRPRGVLYMVTGQGGFRGGLEQAITRFARRPWTDVWLNRSGSYTDVRAYRDRLEIRQLDSAGRQLDEVRLTR